MQFTGAEGWQSTDVRSTFVRQTEAWLADRRSGVKADVLFIGKLFCCLDASVACV